MHIAIVGPGRLGRSLHILWTRAGHTTHLVGREAPLPPSDVVVITVPDRAIAQVVRHLPDDRLLIHTSGATDLDVFEHHTQFGSLHPLMTFPGPEVDLPDLDGVPTAVAGSDAEALQRIAQLASDLGLRPIEVPGDRRLYHAAAVFAGNFATTLLAEAGDILSHAGLDPMTARAMLAPLAKRSIDNAIVDPSGALTGPIARGDKAVTDGHLASLSANNLDNTRRIYEMLAAATTNWAVGSRDSGAQP